MKTISKLSLILSFFIFTVSYAQKFNLSSIELDKSSPKYLFSDESNHYFSNYSTELMVVDKKEHLKVSKLSFKLDTDEEYKSYINEHDGKILLISTASTKKPKKDKPKEFDFVTTKINLYHFDIKSGSKLKKERIDVGDDAEKSLITKIDKELKRIFITQSDSLVFAYDFDFNKTDDKKVSKKARYTWDDSDNGLLFDLEDLLLSFNLGFSIVTVEAKVDSTKTESFIVSHKSESSTQYYFKGYVNEISIKSKLPELNGKSVDLDFDADKLILEFDYKELSNGNLLMFGKYVNKGGGDNGLYGMFSCVFNKELSMNGKIFYEDLVRVNTGEKSIQDKKYIGFIFTKIAKPMHTFHLKDEAVFVQTYQKKYSNLYDHIYILRISESGEMSVNFIVSKLSNEIKTPLYNEQFSAVLAGDRIHFFFYEHPDNLDIPVTELRYTVGSIDKKDLNLVSCTYNVVKDEFTAKTKLTDKRTVKYIPHLVGKNMYFDESNKQYSLFFIGYDKKHNPKLLYFIEFTD